MYFIHVRQYHTNSARNNLRESKWSANDSETDGVHRDDMKVRIAECTRQLGTPIRLLSLIVMLYSSRRRMSLALTEFQQPELWKKIEG